MKEKVANEMSKQIKIFQNEEFGQVRVLEINGEPWLVAKDVAEALGYPQTSIPTSQFSVMLLGLLTTKLLILTSDNLAFLPFTPPQCQFS